MICILHLLVMFINRTVEQACNIVLFTLASSDAAYVLYRVM